MNNKGTYLKYILLVVMAGGLLFAQKPVRIDEILTNQNSFRLDTTLSYSNIQSIGSLSASQTFQTQNGDFVNIPVYLGTTKSNQDYLNMDVTLRYGVTKNLEAFVSLNGYSSSTKSTQLGDFLSRSDKGFNALGAGVTYQVKPEDKTPSLLVGISTQVIEKTTINDKIYTNHFKNFRVFATSFYSVDPVVLLLSTSYTFNKRKSLGNLKRKDANVLTLSPQVYFTVNPYTSLSWGVKYNYFTKSKMEKTIIGNSGSNLSFITGLSYEFSSKMFMNFNAEFLNTSEISQNTFAMTFSYKF